MKLTPISTEPEETNIISLARARDRFRFGKCKHLRVEVDEEKAEVECMSCHAQLSAVAVLARFATEESMWKRQLEGMREMRKILDEKQRCKCQHCGKFTRVRP